MGLEVNWLILFSHVRKHLTYISRPFPQNNIGESRLNQGDHLVEYHAGGVLLGGVFLNAFSTVLMQSLDTRIRLCLFCVWHMLAPTDDQLGSRA